MKLCRFELKAEPGRARSGMVFAGKIYETDGGNAVGVHEAQDVRPLAPIPQAGSLRIFRTDRQPPLDYGDPRPSFFYGNPASLVGPSQIINHPGYRSRLSFETYVAAVLVGTGYRVDVTDADELILGITLMTLLVDKGAEDEDRAAGSGYGRSHDLGGAIGPVLTTPDEIADDISDNEFGAKYLLSTVARVNGLEQARGNLDDLPFTLAQAISAASQTCTVKEGDIFAIGPIVEVDEEILLEGDSEVQLSIDKLGTLSLKLAQDL